MHDQRGKFERDFVAFLEELSIDTQVTGSHAPWQLSLAERHGGILGNIWQAVITEHQCSDRRSVKLALDSALLAKNTTMTRNGHNAYMALLGQEPRNPTSLLADDDEIDINSKQALGQSAPMSLIKLDVSDKLE